jgi:hypothetical protein
MPSTAACNDHPSAIRQYDRFQINNNAMNKARGPLIAINMV